MQELNRILFSAIESSLLGTSGEQLISKLYHGSTANLLHSGAMVQLGNVC